MNKLFLIWMFNYQNFIYLLKGNCKSFPISHLSFGTTQYNHNQRCNVEKKDGVYSQKTTSPNDLNLQPSLPKLDSLKLACVFISNSSFRPDRCQANPNSFTEEFFCVDFFPL